MSRFGKFYGCSAYPKCKFTQPFETKTYGDCPDCEKGKVVQKKTRKGKMFWACNQWPKCEYATWDEPTEKPDSE